MKNEGQIWKLITRGDEPSFEVLFHHYYPQLSVYAARFGCEVHLVEECVQQLFIKIWQNRANLGQPASVKHYLFKALRNTIYNKASVRRQELYIGLIEDFLDFNLSCEPEQGMLFPDLSDEMKHSLDQLTPRQREAVYLFYFEDLAYQEIADILQINIGGVYKLIYRALDSLRTHHDKATIQNALRS